MDFIVIGDSQLWGNKFGFAKFFDEFETSCPGVPGISKAPKYNIISISGSGFFDWSRQALGPTSDNHGDPCYIDETFHFLGNAIPPGASVEKLAFEDRVSFIPSLCQPGQSALQGLAPANPKVIIATFLGAHQGQEDGEDGTKEEQLERAYQQFLGQLPYGSKCVIVTNPPLAHRAHFPKEIKDFWKNNAESKGLNYQEWFKENMAHTDRFQVNRRNTAERIHNLVLKNKKCALVKGFDELALLPLFRNPQETFDTDLSTLEHENPNNYDPFHMTRQGSLEFFRIKGPEICQAIKEVMQ